MSLLAEAWFLERPGEPLRAKARELSDVGPGEASVAVDACGIRHTDLGYASGFVASNHPLPWSWGTRWWAGIARRGRFVRTSWQHVEWRRTSVPGRTLRHG